ELPRPGVRHRIEHAAMTRPDQLARMRELDAVPVPQARFLYEIGDTSADAIGEERIPWVYRHKTFVDAGVRVAGRSDRPCVSAGAPLLGMRSMVERTTKSGAVLAQEECVDAETALRAFTVDAAYAAGQEHVRGTLAAGMVADLVLLDDDPTEVPSSKIGDIEVQATVGAGAATHGAERFGLPG